MPLIKNVDFTSAQGGAILPSKMVRILEPNLLRYDVNLCSGFLRLAIEEKFRGYENVK